MIKTAAHLPGDLNRLTRETNMLLATVDSLSADEMAGASACPGWTRAHLVAHLTLGADAMGNLINWATSGVQTTPYTSPDARDAHIQSLAARTPAELKAALHAATKNFADKCAGLTAELRAETVTTSDGLDITPYAIPTLRTAEVIIHHADLDTVWTLEEADIDALEDTLELEVARVSANIEDGAKGITIDTDERDHHVIGDGATAVGGGRDAVIGWLARGETEGLRYDGTLPELPARRSC